jgi:hypothetical protein
MHPQGKMQSWLILKWVVHLIYHCAVKRLGILSLESDSL